MQITVLGKSPSWPDAGGACSGYLVEDGATCLLLDCGSGVFSQLRRVREYAAIDAVLIGRANAEEGPTSNGSTGPLADSVRTDEAL